MANPYRTHEKQQIQRASVQQRTECLKWKPSLTTHTNIRLVIPYHPALPSVHDITNNKQQILHLSPRWISAFPTTPIIVYSRTKNLRDLLVKVATSNPSYATPGNQPCHIKCCKTCPMHSTKPNLIHKHSNRQNIQHQNTCNLHKHWRLSLLGWKVFNCNRYNTFIYNIWEVVTLHRPCCLPFSGHRAGFAV